MEGCKSTNRSSCDNKNVFRWKKRSQEWKEEKERSFFLTRSTLGSHFFVKALFPPERTEAAHGADKKEEHFSLFYSLSLCSSATLGGGGGIGGGGSIEAIDVFT